MNKINIENFNDLKSWPFKEAKQILDVKNVVASILLVEDLRIQKG